MKQIEIQLRSLSYHERSQYMEHLNKLVFESENEADKMRYKKILYLIDKINMV